MNTLLIGWRWLVSLLGDAEGGFVENEHSSVPMSEYVKLQRGIEFLEREVAKKGLEIRELRIERDSLEGDLGRVTDLLVTKQLDDIGRMKREEAFLKD